MPYKHDYDKTLTRLINILNILNAGAGVATKDLAEEFNVSVRTIQRDLSERLAMFPLYSDKGKWYFIEGYTLEKNLSAEDTLILKIMDKFAESVGDSFYRRTKKLLAKITHEQDSPIYTKLNIEDVSTNLAELKQLEDAISKQFWVSFEYQSSAATYEVKARPLKIINYDGFWYLLAIHKDIVKKYYLKGILKVSVSTEKFEIARDIGKLLKDSTNVWFEGDSEAFEVQLQVSNEVAKYLIRKPCSPTQQIIKETKTYTEISVFVSHEMEIFPTIKRWLPDIKVLSPSTMADKLRVMLERYLKEL